MTTMDCSERRTKLRLTGKAKCFFFSESVRKIKSMCGL